MTDAVSLSQADRPRTTMLPGISILIPVYNASATLERCLAAVSRSRGVTWECIIIDDGSTDDSAQIARRWGAQVLRTDTRRSGPGPARNLGAAVARAPLLCFVDADVVVRPTTFADFAALFDADPGLAAAFGSYDTQPSEPNLLSQYRNLLHHFVHQTGREEAVTFWAGCGAIRASVFRQLGGFSSMYNRPSIEDIELGYRIRAAGGRIRLAKHIQVTHLKRWTFWGILKTDIRDRAWPWTTLIQRSGRLPNDLNLNVSSRISAVSVFALLGLLALGGLRPQAWLVLPLPLSLIIWCNRRLYLFFLQQRGLWFLLRTLPMHWLYYAYSALSFAAGTMYGVLRRRTPGPPTGQAGRCQEWPVARLANRSDSLVVADRTPVAQNDRLTT